MEKFHGNANAIAEILKSLEECMKVYLVYGDHGSIRRMESN